MVGFTPKLSSTTPLVDRSYQLRLALPVLRFAEIVVVVVVQVLWRRGFRSPVWSGFEPSHGSVTARVDDSIS